MTNQIDYQRNTTYTLTHIYQKNGVNSSDGQTLFFTAKESQFDSDPTDGAAIVKKTISMSGPTTVFTLDPPDIADSIDPGKYYWDIKIKESDGPPKIIYPGASGIFNLLGNPTNREA